MEQNTSLSSVPKAFWTNSCATSSAGPSRSPGYRYQPTEAELIRKWLEPYGIDVRRCDCCEKRIEGPSRTAETDLFQAFPQPPVYSTPSTTDNFETMLDKIIQDTIQECEEEERKALENRKPPKVNLVPIQAKVAKKRKLEGEEKEKTKKQRKERANTVSLATPSTLRSGADIQAKLIRLAEEQGRSWAMMQNNSGLIY